jgi:hypothetical protein
MPKIHFPPTLHRHIICPHAVKGTTVREVLDTVFADNPRLRRDVLDDQGDLRQHMTIFLDGVQIRDRVSLSDVVSEDSEIYVMQALSGG